jgi:ATP-binding cassette subfamily B protein
MKTGKRLQAEMPSNRGSLGVQEALESLFDRSVLPEILSAIASEVNTYQLGDCLLDYAASASASGSVHGEPLQDFYLVCSGRVRLLCLHRQREVSAIVRSPGEAFCASPQSRAIAASAGSYVQLPATLIQTQPALKQRLLEHQQQCDRAIFFRTIADVKIDLPTLHQIEEIAIAPQQPLKTDMPGAYWLRSGDVRGTQPPQIGSQWQVAAADWIAQTDVVLYRLPTEAVSRAPTPQNLSDRPDNVILLPKREVKPQPLHFPKARRGLWQRYPWIEQQSASDCGVACLAMISQYWGARLSINALRELARVGRTGTTLKNLATTAETVGYQARPVRASLNRLAEQKRPWIAHWQGDHYVVVYRVLPHRVLVADPARGKRYHSRTAFLASWTGYALLLEPTERLHSAPQGEQPSLGRFWRPFLQHRSTLLQILLMSLLIQVFGLITPLFTQIILDRVVVQKSLPVLNVFALGLAVFSLWQVGITAARQYLLDYFSNRVNLTLVSGFISHALLLPLSFFEQRQVGDIITRVQENNKVQMFLMRQAVSTWLDSTLAIVYLGLMFYYNGRLTLFVLALIPPIVILTLVSTPFLRKISREVFNQAAEQNSLLVEMMSGIGTVKTAAAEREVRWRWEESFTHLLNAQFKGQKLANGLQAASGLINALGSAALLWYGAALVIQDQLTIGQFVAFNLLIGHVISPVLSLMRLWDEFQEVMIAVERLNDVFSAQPEEMPGRPLLPLPPIHGEVQLEALTFRYDANADRNTLQNLNVSISAGETVALVGRSGSGKSTLIKLLQGLYPPSSGRILIDGHDVSHVSPQSLRSQLGVVPQECFLFSGTILDNIRLYRPEFTLEQVVEVAKLAEAHAFIQELPIGYNTKVGERGANLSGGQRQRLAIARALLGDPAILVLDEATSSLDTESERRFQQNLARISTGRTTFIIAHRLATVRHADRILVLDRGILVEQGTHDQLVNRRGLYYHLAQQQLDL